MHRELERAREVGEILSRHGLRALARASGLLGRLRKDGDPEDDVDVSGATPHVLTAALSELGTTWIKLGQMLSTRQDLLPAEYCEALSTLTSSAPAVAWEEIRTVVEDSLEGGVDDLYREFSREPLATASVAQVHAARDGEGRSVVAKVRKPGVVETVEVDLDLMEGLAQALLRARPELADQGLDEAVEAFANTSRAELDFRTEARNCETMSDLLAGMDTVHITGVVRELTTSAVMTQERVTGIHLDDVEALRAAGLDPAVIGERYVDALLRMVFEFGTFHADPHPGNVLVGEDGVLTFLDWGMIGRLEPAVRRSLVRLMVAFSLGNENMLVSALIELAPPRGTLDHSRFRQDVADLAASLRTDSLETISASGLIASLMALIRDHRLHLPGSVSTALRLLAIADGVTRTLSPDLDVLGVATRHAQAAMRREFTPERLREGIEEQLADLSVLAHEMSGHLGRLIGTLNSGALPVSVRDPQEARRHRRDERRTNRLAAAIVSSAALVAGSVLWGTRQR